MGNERTENLTTAHDNKQEVLKQTNDWLGMLLC